MTLILIMWVVAYAAWFVLWANSRRAYRENIRSMTTPRWIMILLFVLAFVPVLGAIITISCAFVHWAKMPSKETENTFLSWLGGAVGSGKKE